MTLRSIQPLLVSLLLVSCIDVRSFEGRWRGDVLEEPAVRQGFESDARVELLELKDVMMQSVAAKLTTNDGKFSNTELQLINKAAGDVLGSLSFDGNPLRTYLLFARPAGADASALMVLSLYSNDHIELRIIHDNDLFGVFYLDREDE